MFALSTARNVSRETCKQALSRFRGVDQASEALRSVSRETLDRLKLYGDHLLRWNGRINLVGRGEVAKLWTRHIADSLQIVPLIPSNTARGIDLGSGAGFPGLILAIATGIPFDLVESDQRKAAFLREAGRVTAAPISVHTARIEEVELEAAAIVTARALAPLNTLLGLAHRFIAPGGVALFPKGAEADRELTEAAAKWHMRVERFPSLTDPAGTILKLSEVQRG